MTAMENSISDAMREEAANWLVQLDDEPNPEQQDAFQQWIDRDQRHRLVFSQMQGLWGAVRAPKKASHLGQVLTLAGVALLAALLSLQLPWQYWQADYRTATGDVRAVTLPDGSVATLNTNSAIDVDFSQGQRRIQLIRGEVLLDVSKDQHRPFIVNTAMASAEALGTIYSVAQHHETSRVTVYESQVRVTSTKGQHTAVLSAGQQAVVDNTTITTHPLSLPAQPDWARQRLVFRNAPLNEVVARLQNYHSGMITLGGETTTNQRRFTGVLPSNDAEAAIALLSSSMGLKVHGVTPWFVYLKPRVAP